jgi:sodium transport system permease protein
VFAPAVIMTAMLTRNPRRTLLLERLPRFSAVAAAAALAVVVHPLMRHLLGWITELYPVEEGTLESAKQIESALAGAPSWWIVVAIMAVLPAVCEELAIRGFVLSGLRHLGHKWWAITISAIAFGAVHMLLQQKLTAAAAGMVIGYIAVQTGSLVPCIVFHAIHNGLAVSVEQLREWALASNPDGLIARMLGGEHPVIYQAPATIACAICAAGILWWLHTLSYRRTAEEQLEEARQRQGVPLVGA